MSKRQFNFVDPIVETIKDRNDAKFGSTLKQVDIERCPRVVDKQTKKVYRDVTEGWT